MTEEAKTFRAIANTAISGVRDMRNLLAVEHQQVDNFVEHYRDLEEIRDNLVRIRDKCQRVIFNTKKD